MIAALIGIASSVIDSAIKCAYSRGEDTALLEKSMLAWKGR
jgi:hypothetical protein